MYRRQLRKCGNLALSRLHHHHFAELALLPAQHREIFFPGFFKKGFFQPGGQRNLNDRSGTIRRFILTQGIFQELGLQLVIRMIGKHRLESIRPLSRLFRRHNGQNGIIGNIGNHLYAHLLKLAVEILINFSPALHQVATRIRSGHKLGRNRQLG